VEWTGSILVVDDDLATREMLVDLLREEGIDARSVGSVDEALEAVRQGEFEAILSDVQMPGKDGFTLLSEIRDRGDRIPVILMTSFGTSETAHKARAAGAVDCLLKPFARSALVAMVTRIFESKMTLDDPVTRP
jgi:DNA-binding NtrC family response regulator